MNFIVYADNAFCKLNETECAEFHVMVNRFATWLKLLHSLALFFSLQSSTMTCTRHNIMFNGISHAITITQISFCKFQKGNPPLI